MNIGSYCNVFADLCYNRISGNMHQWSGTGHPENEFEYSGIMSLLLGTFIALLAVLLATMFLEVYPPFLFALPVI